MFAFLSGALHVFIWVMESVIWTRPSTYRRFGVKTDEEAGILKPMALNQGFYNLFLAGGAIAGGVFVLVGLSLPASGMNGPLNTGLVLAGFSLLCMLLASIVLVISNPRLARAALTQGLFPLLGLILLTIGAVTYSAVSFGWTAYAP